MDKTNKLNLIIFGITGNLAQIKLIPVLYDMAEKGLLPENMTIVGIARKPMTQSQFQDYFYEVLTSENIHHKHEIKKDIFEKLCQKLHYLAGSADDPKLYEQLKKYSGNKIYYLATYPELYKSIFDHLQKNGLNIQNHDWVRLMVEKPIGYDLKSAHEINTLLLQYFSEDQIYRLDHYLGKETLQNILSFRFANDIFEPLINASFIDHIQITALEDFGVGKRGGYYDLVGALKDVGQNHQLQMLAFSIMDVPDELASRAVSKERLKVLKSLVPLPEKTVFGQYEGYQKEENVNLSSQTDTFYAFKTFINNDRFQDVPIYVRAGKKAKQTATEISIVFKNPLNKLFSVDCEDEPNVLIYRIQPNEGIVFKILTKKPGHQIKLEPEYMQYCYKVDPHTHYIPDPYERLLVDTIRGDQTFFNTAEEVEAQWAFIDPLANARSKPSIYQPGSWGPKEADELIEADGRMWLEPSMAFCRI
ncbi:glucose-6-phosphate dehydrogenase [Candidatus Daviesbacteria bacterium]|nr:glucose-6-phosphate dehydrogenase [Candidatus Daviesbacteria bacterium]